ncbi:MAG: hypothetical protein AB9873_06035 [Syntrophobacteraceae bacterium]
MSLLKTPARLRIARRTLSRAQIYRSLRAPCFPTHFFVRNLAYLERETWFARKGPVARGRWAAILFRERLQCFRDIRRLIGPYRGEPAWRRDPVRSLSEPRGSDTDYCDHCGGCCEIASGLPEFPVESDLPERWRLCFGEGFSPGHRFCAFMWGGDRPGTSLCAIHPWRANPCRVFEADDCEMFKQDIDFTVFSKSRRLKVLRRLLPRILRRNGARQSD